MRTTFDRLFSDIARLDASLSSPVELHARQRQPYHKTARAIARRVLTAAKPPDHDSASWNHKVEKTLDRITSESMLWAMTTLELTLPPESSGDLATKENRPAAQRVSHPEVVEWIRSGVNGEAGGKRITSRDREILNDPKQGESALATIVMRAYYSRNNPANYTRLRRAIQRYLTGEEAASDPLLDAVLLAWHEHFAVRFPRDMAAHVARLAAGF
jgi:hypothetical protein